MRVPSILGLLCLTQISIAQMSGNKSNVLSSVDKHQKELIQLSDQVWSFAELAMKETNSAKVLADYAEKQGFRVKRGVAAIPTAFVAEYGSGRPIIGILGEFDALPGLSQKTEPVRAELQPGGNGHGCGHNMFGAGSLGAAVAVKELIASGKLKGTIRFYGTPAEEDRAGKVYMAREGLFSDLDVCLDWHPDAEIRANMQSSQAVIDHEIIFKGKSAHAAFDPWNGRSALDAAQLFTDGINYLREHVRPSVRMHYVFKDAGKVPNVIPESASVWLWIRDSKRSGVKAVEERMRDIAKGAALMAGVDYEIKLNSGLYELLVNEAGATALQKNLELLGGISYTPEELAFAEKIMKEYGAPYKGMDAKVKPLEKTNPDPAGGSTDVGDVSYIVPEITLMAPTAPAEAPWHSWVVVACGGMSIGHKGMLYAAKALGLTMVDLFENEKLRTDIRKEFEARKGNEVWKAQLPDGPPNLD
ncbi:amidohydrolase [Flavihumibacter rivuli]|uniref:amidohydrolase n=1 Tax=Flavihumibacter rivuli TaxID=2838156 RepID=UPI001BDE65C1|nr:amidohydrolase [Flavihumibacter rivuli]ULQ55704.1 amidohydrolase [Flavihumibacter rivuli]